MVIFLLQNVKVIVLEINLEIMQLKDVHMIVLLDIFLIILLGIAYYNAHHHTLDFLEIIHVYYNVQLDTMLLNLQELARQIVGINGIIILIIQLDNV